MTNNFYKNLILDIQRTNQGDYINILKLLKLIEKGKKVTDSKEYKKLNKEYKKALNLFEKIYNKGFAEYEIL